MKILITTGLFPPQIGGPATYSKLLLEKLPEYGYRVEIASFGTVLCLPKIIRHIIYFFTILFKGFSADIIYAQDPVSVGLPSMLAAKILRKKFFLKIVGDYAWEQGVQRSRVVDHLDKFSTEYRKYPFLIRFFKRIEYFTARSAKKIIVPSNYLKKIVSNWGIPKDKIFVIYNAFEKPTLLETKEELRKKFGFRGPVVVSVGRLVPWKGFSVLIETIPELLKEFPELKFYIIGDGPDKNCLKSQISNLNPEDKIILTGKLPQEKVFQYIKASDVFVLNTSYEGFSHQLLEVLSMETPIITTKAGGNVEIIEDGKNGLFIPYNDKKAIQMAVSTILKDKTYGEKLAEQGFKSLKMFTEENMLNRLDGVLRNVL